MAKINIATDADFDQQVLKSDKVVLVDFWAEWCGPCRMIAPIVEEIADEFPDNLKVLKLNTDENPKIMERYQVKSIPTLAIFKNGQLHNRLIGYRPKARLAEEISESLL